MVWRRLALRASATFEQGFCLRFKPLPEADTATAATGVASRDSKSAAALSAKDSRGLAVASWLRSTLPPVLKRTVSLLRAILKRAKKNS
jgi:hypothetical protein